MSDRVASTNKSQYLFSEVTIEHVRGGSTNDLLLIPSSASTSASSNSSGTTTLVNSLIPSHWVVSDRKKKSLSEFIQKLNHSDNNNNHDTTEPSSHVEYKIEPEKFFDPWIGITHEKSMSDYFSILKQLPNRPSVPSDEELPQLQPQWDLLFQPHPFHTVVNADTQPISTQHEFDKSSTTYQVTWIGHSTFLIQYRGINILTDPVFAERCSPVSFFGPKRIKKIPVDDIAKLPPIHFVCVSHNHYDHLCEASIRDLQKYHDPIILLPYKCKYKWMQSGYLNQEKMNSKLYELDWWKDVTFKVSAKHANNSLISVESEIRFEFLPAQHWGSRSFADRNEALWGSWGIEFKSVIHRDEQTIDSGKSVKFWHAGDTGYNSQTFTEIGKRFGPIDLAFIPIGAYHPRQFLKDQHVDPEEAITIAQEVGAKKSIGMHWGTFILTLEPVMEPKQLLEKGLIERKLPSDYFITMKHGETIVGVFHENVEITSAPAENNVLENLNEETATMVQE
ncbi:hypothetical protein C9374_007586 [Naegleria lovaniensis]|uniref:Metallo-beta-lactamase domain-containing protein n=1 Tax=Naegleria lovaniensis TaxID=51637 RepID=A0AA88GI07_NAELO|nr:uncharacterized protein C9374_007586 [Naegleria lovaniensis]KAG2378948.1 hypothetical protein C9374_007586 [Naegleria lovaniensis]